MGARVRTLDKIKCPANHPPPPKSRMKPSGSEPKRAIFSALISGGGGRGGGGGWGVNFPSNLSKIAVTYPLPEICFTAFFTNSSSVISEYVCILSFVFSVSYSIEVTFKY